VDGGGAARHAAQKRSRGLGRQTRGVMAPTMKASR
jgi:hypothetical protein